MSLIEDNKAIACRWLELISEHKVEEICEMTAPAWRMYGGPPQGLPAGPAGVRELFRIIGPVDQKWTIEDVIAEGDRVVVRATNSCVQENFLGIPARGRRQIFAATFIHRIADGKIHETWRNADFWVAFFNSGSHPRPLHNWSRRSRRRAPSPTVPNNSDGSS